MRGRAFARLVLLGALGVAPLVACGFSAELSASDFGPTAEARDEGGASNGEGSVGAAPLGPTSEGVILAHAALAPAVRLCFGSALDAPPQPARQVMPQSNVVGLERGAAVRLTPLGRLAEAERPDAEAGAPSPAPDASADAGGPAAPLEPDELVVLRELVVRQREGAPATRSCRELLSCDPSTQLDCPVPGSHYVRIRVPEMSQLGSGLHVASLEGCAPDRVEWQGAGRPRLTAGQCGPGFDPERGNLTLRVRSVERPTSRPTRDTLPVQVLNLSYALEFAARPAGVSVRYAHLEDAGPGESVAAPVLGTIAPAAPARVPLPLDEDGIFERAAFTVTAGPVSVRQTLAEIQQLSSPGDAPKAYWGVGTNYLLLVLGDPAITPDAGAQVYEGVHLLAVPVANPDDLADAGADSGAAGSAADAASGTGSGSR